MNPISQRDKGTERPMLRSVPNAAVVLVALMAVAACRSSNATTVATEGTLSPAGLVMSERTTAQAGIDEEADAGEDSIEGDEAGESMIGGDDAVAGSPCGIYWGVWGWGGSILDSS